TTFGNQGQVTLSTPAAAILSVAVQPNNQILVGGAFGTTSDCEFGVARFNPDGSLDSNFAGGVAEQWYGSGSDSALEAMALQPDGGIVAVGTAANSSGPNSAVLARLAAGDVADAPVNAEAVASGATPLSLSGDSSVAAGTPYTLALGDGSTDLGIGPYVDYVVNWGDGSPETTVSAADLEAQQGQVVHTYASAPTSGSAWTITVSVSIGVFSGATVTYANTQVGSLSVSVNMTDATTTSLSVSPSTPSLGQSVTLTATVAAAGSAAGTPSGTVEFYDGTIDLGSGTLALSGGHDVATLTTPPLGYGDHAFTAVYSGDTTFEVSNSATEIVPVSPTSMPPAVPLVLSPLGSATAGQNYTLSLPTQAGGQTITQWSINWGDGSTDTLVSPADMNYDTHIYQDLGNYLVQAYATSSAGTYPAVLDVDVVKPSQEPTFSNGSVSSMAGSLTSLAIQPDGSIVALQGGAGVSPALVRFSSAGQPDGTNFGIVSASIPTLSAVAVQPVAGDFDIVAAGSGYCVARFDSDGSLDTSFGGNGIASPLPLGEGQSGLGEGGSAVPSTLLVQPDGKIVLVGLVPDGSGGEDLEMVRFTAAGLLDSQANDAVDPFGNLVGGQASGIYSYDLGQAADCTAVIEPDGDIIVAVGVSSNSTKVLALTAGGSGLDSSFAVGGSFTTSTVTGNPILAVQPDGEFDLAGSNGNGYAVQQYTSGGSPEWSPPVTVTTGQAGALAVQPSGRVVVAVDTVSGQTNSWTLAGFTNTAAVDSVFDELGQISGLTGSSAALAVEPNGDILLGGADAVDAFLADYGADSAAVAVAEPDATITNLSLSFNGSTVGASPIQYSGADTESGGASPGVAIDGSFTDTGMIPEAHTVTFSWGDGSAPGSMSLTPGQTTFSYPLPQYAVTGNYTITVTVTDADGKSTTSVSTQATVSYASTQPTGLSLSLGNSTIQTGGELTLSGSFSDPQSNLAHTVTINWGDGTQQNPDLTTLTLDSGETTFQASPNSQSYATAGNYTISANIAGLDGGAAPTVPITVSALPSSGLTLSLSSSSVLPG
ncbi:MAG: Ig-like domain repeat protein, partial [Thermoguttaceae bacterium]